MLKRMQFFNRMKNRKTNLLRSMAIFFILVGIWMSSQNLYYYSRSYLTGWLYTSPASAKEEDTRNLDQGVNSETENTAVTREEASSDTTVDLDYKSTSKTPLVYKDRPETGEQFGELYIPKLAATLSIYEGTDEEELELGVGHYEGSVLPGEKDNCVLAGHRDTVFRRLGEVGVGDKLLVRTLMGEFEYVINKVRIVDKEDRTVIVPKPKATLTISTCYPFRYIGSAPQRYVLVAYLASTNQSNQENER